MIKSLKWLKQYDIFVSEVPTFVTTRNKKTNQKTFSDNHGSIMGGILSLITTIATIVYICTQINMMMSQNYDG